MSYAEQYFAVKEAEARDYADNLAWFGEDSYVYRNEKAMKKVLNSITGLQNPVANEYIAKWISDNGYDASDIINNGFTIGVYNQDLERTIYFDAIKQFDDGSMLYITNKEQIAFIYAQMASDSETSLGTDLYTYDDFIGTAYLNSKITNWFSEFNGKDKYGQNPLGTWSMTSWLKYRPGFLHGISKDFIEKMKPVEPNAGDYLCLPLVETYITDISRYAFSNTSFFQTDINVYNDYVEAVSNGVVDTTINTLNAFVLPRTKGNTTNYWIPFIPNLVSGNFTYPRKRGTVAYPTGNYVTNAQVQAASQSEISTLLDGNTPVDYVHVTVPKHCLIRI